jgi:hypothetical protein
MLCVLRGTTFMKNSYKLTNVVQKNAKNRKDAEQILPLQYSDFQLTIFLLLEFR